MKVVQRRAPARDPAALEPPAVSDGGGTESLYEAYVRKRDAKLREEWGAKEAKMSALRERLEESSAEMKASLSGPGRRGGEALFAGRHADISKASGSTREIHKEDEQVYDGVIDSVQDGFTGEVAGSDSSKFADFDNKSSGRSISSLAHPKPSTSIDEPRSSDFSKGSIPGKRISGRSFSSPLRVNSVASPPRPSSKPINGTGKSRLKQEKSAGHNTPSTPDLKVKSVKQSVERLRPTMHTYRRSTQEESGVVKEEKPHRSRRNSVNPVESRSDLAPRDISSSPVRSDHKQVQRGVKPKSFLRKGRGAGQVGAGNSSSERKMVAPSSVEEQVLESLMDQASDRVSIVQEDGDIGDSGVEELDGPSGMAQEFSAEEEIFKTDNDISEFSIGSVCSVYPYSETEEALVSSIQMQIDASSAVDDSARTTEDFAEEVSSLQDTDAHNPPSYEQEASEFDVSEDNYMGSTQVWCGIPSDQRRGDDSAKMNANTMMHATNSQPQVVKDMRKRLMRLLNFGRKRRGSETSENDWVSTPKLEGVRGNEDCQEPAIRGSEIAKSSRRGFSDRYSTDDGRIVRSSSLDQGQTSQDSVRTSGSLKAMDDNISGSLLKVPRSFLSLANLRSKVGESRQR